MTSKKTKFILVLLFILTVVVLPTLCVFIPYRDVYMEDEMTSEGAIGEDTYYIAGTITNPSIVAVDHISYHIVYFDDFGEVVGEQNITVDGTISAFSSKDFESILTLPQYASTYVIDEIIYSYTTLAPWAYYMIGVCLYGSLLFFFMKKKLYFDIDKHKVVVLAGPQKASIMIDGKVYKTLEVKTKGAKEEYKIKVAGKILAINFKMSTPFPDIAITVDGVVPKFSKIEQHSFLKMQEENKQAKAPALDENNAETTKTEVQQTEKQETKESKPKAEKKTKIQQLEELYKEGVITAEEFEEYKELFKD